jgi:hypothetical protein
LTPKLLFRTWLQLVPASLFARPLRFATTCAFLTPELLVATVQLLASFLRR